MTSSSILDAAVGMKSTILEARDQTESGRKLAAPIVKELIGARLGRMALPADVGGLDCDPSTMMTALEELGSVEASVAWIVWNNALPCLFSRFLPDAARREIFTDPEGLYASSTRPTGKAVVDGNTFRITGRWSLVSGCMHADWIALMCLVERDGKLEMIQPGAPQMSLAFVPKQSLEILDTWHVGGLRGTGSHDVVADNLVVPADRMILPITEDSRVDAPLGRIPIVATMAAGHASMCLGIARGTVEVLIDLARSKVSPDAGPGLGDRPATQQTLATTMAQLKAWRLGIHHAVDVLWEKVRKSEPWSPADVADVFAAALTAAAEAKEAVGRMYALAGASALYTDCAIERAHRDIHAATQHVIVQPFWLEQVGRVRLGLPPTHPLFML